ncbi:MAG TPA: hypothetical protein PK027_14455 [Aquimonas sp.]|nr:hypothetical protein [Aquimonas sp.]
MLKMYGPFGSVHDFEMAVLTNPEFATYCLRPAHIAAIRTLLGPLPTGKVYIPGLYPHLGGSDEPETYHIGDFCVFMEIVGQTHGFS